MRRRPGNYLAFFSSFDYLEQAANLFAELHPEVPVWRQERRMSELERAAFLDASTPRDAASVSPCWAAPLAKASTCRARA
jgi:Rad3-related DNA helicase